MQIGAGKLEAEDIFIHIYVGLGLGVGPGLRGLGHRLRVTGPGLKIIKNLFRVN